MLIKNDFDQIRKIVREEIENEAQGLKRKLNSKIIMSRMLIQDDISGLKDRVKNLEISLANQKGEDIMDEEDEL